jgi:hypothetical protein
VDTVEIGQKEALDMVLSGGIRDGKTITGILILNRINELT